MPTETFTSALSGIQSHFPFVSHYVHVLTVTEQLRHRSNEYADAAIAYGEAGAVVTAEVCAECADLLAEHALFRDLISPPDPSPVFNDWRCDNGDFCSPSDWMRQAAADSAAGEAEEMTNG